MAGIKFDADDIYSFLQNSQAKSEVAINMYAQEGAKKMESYAKQHRQWTDRTGHARQRLQGWVEKSINKTMIYIGHGVDYGVYLEQAHEKRYEILNPTVNACSNEILKSYKDLLKEVSK